MTNNHYSYETKLEAIRLLNSGMPGRKICEKLGLKSDGLIYTWRKRLQDDGEYYRLSQPAGKQYKYHKGIKALPENKQTKLKIEQMKEELEVVKKYLIKGKVVVNNSTIRLIKELNAHITITRICEILKLSRATYYRHEKHLEDTITYTQQESRIHQLCIENHFLYGYRKIHALLKKEMDCSVSKVQRIMKKHNWSCQIKQKRFNKPGNPYKVVDNVINHDWITNSPLQKLTTDITYLPFGSSNLYLFSILDSYNSEIVAYKISNKQDVTLAVDTLKQLPELTEATILHSDQGSVFTSKKFFDLARKKGITRSMSRKGTPCDNAPIESFHSNLKSETFYNQLELSSSKDIIIETVENYINFWNTKRIFTKLGHQSPVEYRKSMT